MLEGVLDRLRSLAAKYGRRRPRAAAATSREARLRWIDELRKEWMAVVRPFDRELESIFPLAPVLEPRHLSNCRVVPSREFLVRECLPKQGVVAEVGTLRGYFAEVILTHAAPRELHLIDLSFKMLDYAPFEQAIEAGRVRLHEQDSASALASFPDEYFDWIYIDANHMYPGVRNDAWIAKTKVKDGGLLIFNDYIFWSHVELLQYGVVHAVNEMCLEENWEFVWLALPPDMYCDVAIRRIGADT